MSAFRKAVKRLLPTVKRSTDGREKWPSRAAYILAGMGGTVGIGNLLRYPSVAFQNSGAQWFVPYITSLVFVGLPILTLEICFGQAYRGGTVVAYGRVSNRLRGLGLITVYVGYMAVTYYAVIMSWVMTYFRNSFRSPLPWILDNKKFYKEQVLRNPEPIQDPNRIGLIRYPATGVIGETLGWTLMTWLIVYLCTFRGVSLTGRVVYFTMLFPLLLIVIITIRAVTLENAGRGILLHVGQWSWQKLGGAKIWKDAVVEIFFGIGAGFGFYTAYASYNSKYANAVQDSVIIACSNSVVEMLAGFAAFGVLGHLNQNPSNTKVSTFDLGFLTYPLALSKLPGSNAWSVIFFLTVYLLGIDSAFAILEGSITVVLDTDWGKKPPRPLVVGLVTLSTALVSVMYTTEFGVHLFRAVDKWIMEVTLIFCMWLQCSLVPTLYRYKDVISQTGLRAFLIAQCSYFSSMLLGVILGKVLQPGIGGGVFGGVLIVGTVTAVLVSNEPSVTGPWGKNRYVNSLWWLTIYSGNQLRNDLNMIVARGKNWKIPALWAPILRWLSAPLLLLILAIAYDETGVLLKDPLQIFSFVLAHVGVVVVLLGIIVPSIMNVWTPAAQKSSWERQYSSEPGKTLQESEDNEIDLNSSNGTDGNQNQEQSACENA